MDDKLTQSQILNEIAGRNAASMVQWVVPQLMDAIDDESTDVERLLDDIVDGVLHHPAQRDLGNRKVQEGRHRFFKGVEEWWQEMGDRQREDYRRKLTRDGVQNGENHKEGVHDTGHGHGCAGKLKMRKLYGGGEDTLEDKIAGAAADAIFKGATGALSGMVEQNTGYKMPSSSRKEDKAEGGLSGFLNQASSILGGAFGDDETKKQSSSRREDDGSYTRTETEYGRHGDHYGQAQYSQTQRPDGSQHEEYRRYEQRDSSDGRHTGGYGYEERTETHQSYSGGYEQRTERHEYYGSNEESHGRRRDDNDGGYGGRRQEESSYGRQESSYGGSSGYGRQEESSYGGSSGYGRQEESGYGRSSGYGRQEQSSYGGGYGGSSGGYERREESGYGGSSGYGGERRQEGGYGGDSYGRQDDNGYGGGSADDYVRQSQGSYGRERRGSRGSRGSNEYGDNGYGGDRRW